MTTTMNTRDLVSTAANITMVIISTISLVTGLAFFTYYSLYITGLAPSTIPKDGASMLSFFAGATYFFVGLGFAVYRVDRAQSEQPVRKKKSSSSGNSLTRLILVACKDVAIVQLLVTVMLIVIGMVIRTMWNSLTWVLSSQGV